MAWLHATPKPAEGTKRAEKGAGAALSRIDRLKRDSIPAAMPPNPAPHIITRLIEIGLTETNGMGAVPLSWREIHYWQQDTGVALSAWEARTLRELSVAYVAESRRAECENCPPPWRAEITQRERDVTEARLRSVLG